MLFALQAILAFISFCITYFYHLQLDLVGRLSHTDTHLVMQSCCITLSLEKQIGDGSSI